MNKHAFLCVKRQGVTPAGGVGAIVPPTPQKSKKIISKMVNKSLTSREVQCEVL